MKKANHEFILFAANNPDMVKHILMTCEAGCIHDVAKLYGSSMQYRIANNNAIPAKYKVSVTVKEIRP